MAFCNNCGTQLKGTERFCAQCGADVSGKAASAAAPGSAPVNSAATPGVIPPPVQPVAAGPVHYVPAGAVAVAMPPVAPTAKKGGGMMGTVIAVVIVAGIGYYFYNKSHTPAAPAPALQPASQPGSQPGSGSGANAALVKQQTFNAHWQEENGMLVLTTATWVNNSSTALSSAVVQCEQYNAGGTDLSQYRITLNGPTNPGATSSYSNVQIGAVANGMAKVDCDILHVKQ